MTSIHRPPHREYVGPSPNIMKDGNGKPLVNFGPDNPLKRIVIHCTVSPCVDGGRYDIAKIFKHRDPKDPSTFKSAHYVADPGGVVQVVFDHLVAEHAPPNPGSIGIELCDALISKEWDIKHRDRWQDEAHLSMLNKTARLVARLGLAYDLPLHRIIGKELKTQRGICGHIDVSVAFGQTDHWDPGTSFPWGRFMLLVKEQAYRIEHGSK